MSKHKNRAEFLAVFVSRLHWYYQHGIIDCEDGMVLLALADVENPSAGYAKGLENLCEDCCRNFDFVRRKINELEIKNIIRVDTTYGGVSEEDEVVIFLPFVER